MTILEIHHCVYVCKCGKCLQHLSEQQQSSRDRVFILMYSVDLLITLLDLESIFARYQKVSSRCFTFVCVHVYLSIYIYIYVYIYICIDMYIHVSWLATAAEHFPHCKKHIRNLEPSSRSWPDDTTDDKGFSHCYGHSHPLYKKSLTLHERRHWCLQQP